MHLSHEWDVPLAVHEPIITEDSTHILSFVEEDGTTVDMAVNDGTLLKTSDLPYYDKSLYDGWAYQNTKMLYCEEIPVYEDTILYLYREE